MCTSEPRGTGITIQQQLANLLGLGTIALTREANFRLGIGHVRTSGLGLVVRLRRVRNQERENTNMKMKASFGKPQNLKDSLRGGLSKAPRTKMGQLPFQERTLRMRGLGRRAKTVEGRGIKGSQPGY